MAGPFFWIGGSGSKSWQDANNWSLSSGGAAAAAYPGQTTTGEVANIGTTASSSSIDTSLTFTNGAGTLNVYPGFTGSIGTTGGSALDLNGSAVNYYGNASFANFADSGAIVVNTANTGLLTFSGKDYTNTNITVLGGNVTFAATATDLGDGTGVVEFLGGAVTIDAGSGLAVTFTAQGGARVFCARAIGTTNVTGQGTLLKTTGTGAVARANVEEYATYIINSTGTITDLYNRPRGRITLSGASGVVPITNYYQYAGAKATGLTEGLASISADTIFDSPGGGGFM
jgi:hypothetical protein